MDPDVPGVQPPLDSERTPVEDIVSGGSRFLRNPYDVGAWFDILAGLTVILGGGKLVRKVSGVVGPKVVAKAKKALNGS